MAFENILALKEALLDMRRLTDQENWRVFGTYALIGLLGWKVVTAIHWRWRAR